MNYFDNPDDDESDFRDTPDEINEMDAAPVNVRSVPASRPAVPPPQKQVVPTEVYEDEEVEAFELEDEEEDYSSILSDARLRLEQGKLYELIMNHSLFEGVESDEKAIKNVQREIRKFAQERMEVMLGMRQAVEAPQAMLSESFPFNALEVEVLKSLAATATQGASREADAYVPEVPAVRKTLNPISRPQQKTSIPKPVGKVAPKKSLPSKPAQPVRRPKVDEKVQRILKEEGVTLEQLNEVFPPDYKSLDPSFMETLTPEQIAERNTQAARRTQRQAVNPAVAPIPSQDAINSMYERRAATASQNPQMQTIMNLLMQRK